MTLAKISLYCILKYAYFLLRKALEKQTEIKVVALKSLIKI